MTQTFAGFHHSEVKGVPILWLQDHRFKSFRITLSARRPLDRRAAARSLLPSLLLQGTEQDPDRPSLARRMESLYGATVAPATAKVGETHLLRFALDCVAGEYLPGLPDQLGEGLVFLSDFLSRPLLEGDGFPKEVFERERLQAANDVRAIFDDKGSYAYLQAIARAFEGEPMAIPEHGTLEDIEGLDRQDPERARQDFLRSGQLLLLAMGVLPENGGGGFLERVEGFLGELPARQPEELPAVVVAETGERRASVERVELQQSKMILIFRLPESSDPALWMGRSLFANMLGGGPHSRLFREVREKQSLAYYAHARLDRFKSLMIVQIGLDESSATAVESEVLRQAAELSKASFTGEELETARAGILSVLSSIGDSVLSQVGFVEDQWHLSLNRTPEDMAKAYLGITASDVAQSMEGWKLDYSYLLAPAEETEERSPV